LVARTGKGLAELEAAVELVAKRPELAAIAETAWSEPVLQAIASARACDERLATLPSGGVLWWLCAEPSLVDRLQPGLGQALRQAVPRELLPETDLRRRVVHERYQRIDAVTAQRVQRQGAPQRSQSDRIDDVLLHPLAGGLLFLLAMGSLFQAVFAWAQPLADGVAALMNVLASAVRDHLPANLLRAVLIDGVLVGVGGTLVFLPQILILFTGIALLEDSGYLARAAFLADRLMARVGLPGKAFVPLLSSHACAVPGILATRTMNDPRDRLLTILIAPLMSCSARLPVYTMVTAAVFAGSTPLFGILSLGGLIVAAMYFLGFLLALLAAAIFRRTLVPGAGAPLLLEMPPYRLPRLPNIARVLWDRGRDFVVTTGTTIVLLSVVLWGLMTFPQHGLDPAERTRLNAEVTAQHLQGEALAQAKAAIEARDAQIHLQQSAAGRLGHFIEPLIKPLGFDWRIGIGLVGSFAAREVLVPVMAQVYGKGSQADVDDRFAADVGRSMAGAGGLTPLSGLSLMVFFAIAMQCLNTLATIAREAGSWRWALFALTYLNTAAWLASLGVYQLGKFMGYS
jgi:ferrous iron transport protein B